MRRSNGRRGEIASSSAQGSETTHVLLIGLKEEEHESCRWARELVPRSREVVRSNAFPTIESGSAQIQLTAKKRRSSSRWSGSQRRGGKNHAGEFRCRAFRRDFGQTF